MATQMATQMSTDAPAALNSAHDIGFRNLERQFELAWKDYRTRLAALTLSSESAMGSAPRPSPFCAWHFAHACQPDVDWILGRGPPRLDTDGSRADKGRWWWAKVHAMPPGK
ncbi:hypothetical protein E4U41_003022 [Claviceps citrina]|nr:hypothetical protein E4U41_003022 [Claviceps citrina]